GRRWQTLLGEERIDPGRLRMTVTVTATRQIRVPELAALTGSLGAAGWRAILDIRPGRPLTPEQVLQIAWARGQEGPVAVPLAALDGPVPARLADYFRYVDGSRNFVPDWLALEVWVYPARQFKARHYGLVSASEGVHFYPPQQGPGGVPLPRDDWRIDLSVPGVVWVRHRNQAGPPNLGPFAVPAEPGTGQRRPLGQRRRPGRPRALVFGAPGAPVPPWMPDEVRRLL